jgi:membrane protein DedA with SNARE-associated domain
MSPLADLVATHGYWLIALTVGIESMGIPLPGETMLVTAAIYAGATHHMSIALVVAAAALGATLGDNLGFLIGQRAFPWLQRHGHVVRLDKDRLRLGEYLFRRHGGKVVFFGRFVAVLRAFAALLAGANQMAWSRFLFFNASGAVVWSGVYGGAGYWFGEAVERLTRPLGLMMLGAGAVGAIAGVLYVRRHEAALQAAADAELRGAPRESPQHAQ